MNRVIGVGFISIASALVVMAATMFGIQSVAADATSTEPTNTVVIEQPPETVSEPTEAPAEGTGAAATTTAAVGEPVADLVASTSTPATISPSEEAQGTKPAAETVTADVAGLEDAYFQKTGSYLQILRGNGLPTYESGTIVEKLGKDVPADAWVHVYEAPGGKGYQVLYEDADGTLHSVGYGPEVRIGATP
jgi:hypothetical protein